MEKLPVQIVTLLTIYVTQLIKHLVRSAWPCPQVTCPDHDRYILLFPHYSCHFTWAPSYLTPVTNLDCVWRYTCYRGKGQCLRALYFREELVLCLDHSVQIPHSQHYLFQAILCCMHLPYIQQIRQWPAMASTYSRCQLATHAALVARINCATRVAKSCELCTITSSFLLILPDLARPSIPSTTPFPWHVEKYFHEIVPLTFWVILYRSLVHEL